MPVIKKINLKSIEKYLDSVVILSSKIKAKQDELKYLEEMLENNKKEFSCGLVSKKLYTLNKRNSERKKKSLKKKNSRDIKKTLNKIEKLEKVLRQVEV